MTGSTTRIGSALGSSLDRKRGTPAQKLARHTVHEGGDTYLGIRNYLIDGGSGTGKTAVCDELQRRGYQAIHGDRELRASDEDRASEHHLPPRWDVLKVAALLSDQGQAVTFLCGGCRNSSDFVDLLDGVFVLEVDDLATVMRRIDERLLADPSDWGGRQEERDIITRLHHTKEGLAEGWTVDATAPLRCVVEEILRRVHSHPR